MAEVDTSKVPSLAEQYVLPKDAKDVEVPTEEAVKEADILPTAEESVDATEESVETPAVIEEVSEEVKVNGSEETPEVIEAASEEITITAEDENSGDKQEATEETPEVSEAAASEEITITAEDEKSGDKEEAAEDTPEVIEAASEEITITAEDENSGDQEKATEETPEIKLETAPADFRFPTTNQTRHCFTRYVEFHRCVAAKGDGAPECDKFAKYYRSLCPGEWVDRWNEQRENGTFPGRL